MVRLYEIFLRSLLNEKLLDLDNNCITHRR